MSFIKTLVDHFETYMENETIAFILTVLGLYLFGPSLVLYYLGVSFTRNNTLPPGPTPLPILGCLFQMLKNKSKARWIYQVMNETNAEIACIRLGGVHVIPVKSSELAREFLKRQDAIFSSRPYCMSGRLASYGYSGTTLSPLGDQWRKMRRIVATEVASSAKFQWLHDKRAEEADHLVHYVFNQTTENTLKGGVVSVRTIAQHYCGNVIRMLVFNKRFFQKGGRYGGPGAEEEEHVAGLFAIQEKVYGFCIADYVPWLEAFDFDGHKRSMEKAIESVHKYNDPEIDERIQMWKKGLKEKEEDILDVFINLKDAYGFPLLTVEEIRAQIIDMMVGAVDNPSNAIEWAIAEMINQPDIFRKAHKELDDVVGRDRLVQESDLSKLNFVKACAKEAFRLHPISYFSVPHVSTKDTIVSGYFIPKGSHVLLSRPGLGRNPRVWNDPLRYVPERHLHTDGSEVLLTDPELHMFSFSVGRRGCPAVQLGSTMTTMLLARLVQGFTWEAPNAGESRVDLAESERSMFLSKPLHALAKPRLSEGVYKQLKRS